MTPASKFLRSLKYVHYTCKRCGRPYLAKDRDYKPTCSDECAWARCKEAVQAMRSKSGPMYDKWLARTQQARQHKGG